MIFMKRSVKRVKAKNKRIFIIGVVVILILILFGVFIFYQRITGNVVGDESSGVYSGDSVGVFNIPTSNFFLKDSLEGDIKDRINFVYQKEKDISNRFFMGCRKKKITSDEKCFYKITKDAIGCSVSPYKRAYYYAGARMGSQVPLIGDWDGDGIDSPGMYNPITGEFLLKNSNLKGKEDIKFKFGKKAYDQWPSEEQYVFGKLAQYMYPLSYPVLGDWDNDGIDTIGLYDPFNSTFYLRNSNSEGEADIIFKYGNPIRKSTEYRPLLMIGWDFLCSKISDIPEFSIIPVVGDWDGDGKDSVGLYDLDDDKFFLTNENSENLNPEMTTKMYLSDSLKNNNVYSSSACQYGSVYYDAPIANCNNLHERIPISGDWDGDGADEIGLYSQITQLFYLKNDFRIKKNDPYNIGYDKIITKVNGIGESRAGDGYQLLLNKFPLVGNWDSVKTKSQCTPNCSNPDGTLKECGDNGCGGFCGKFGNCGQGLMCGEGRCVTCVPKTCAEIEKECMGPWDDGCGNPISCGNCEDKPNTKCSSINGNCESVGEPVNILKGKKPKWDKYLPDRIYFEFDRPYDLINISFYTPCSGKKCGCITYILGGPDLYKPEPNVYCPNGKCFFNSFKVDYSYYKNNNQKSGPVKRVTRITTYCKDIRNYKAFGTPSVE